MNIFRRLDQLTNLTQNEKTIVSYIKNHPYEFINQEPTEVCTQCFVSKSTLYRLCKKLGMHGCQPLKVEVSTSMQEHYTKEIDYDYPITAYQNQYEVLQNLKTLYDRTVQETIQLADLQTLTSVALKMKEAKEINIYTSAGNLYFAENFKFQMSEINVTIQVPVEQYDQYWLAARSTPEKVALIISFGGRSRYIDDLARLLKKNKTPIVLITSTKNEMQKFASDVLYMASKEDHAMKMSSFGTRLSLLYILDCLYATFYKLDYEKNAAFKAATYEIMRR